MRRIAVLAVLAVVAVFAVPDSAAACLACSGDPNYPGVRWCGHGAIFNFDSCPGGEGSQFSGECDQCAIQTTSVPFESINVNDAWAVGLAVAFNDQIELHPDKRTIVLRSCVGGTVATRELPEGVAAVVQLRTAGD
ncbi:MAG: hypothetical protein R6U63_16220 [Longimicrobiales bacterium]